MAKNVDEITEDIRKLPDVEKLRWWTLFFLDLDKPDPEIDRVWADESETVVGLQSRQSAYGLL
jgi:hypothetical protein